MRGAPQVGFSATIRKIKARTSLLTRFRPPTWLILETHVQYKRNPARCQFTTVLGVTKTRGCLHPDQHILNATQNSLFRAVNRRRGRCACRASNCRRRARFSRTRSTRQLKELTNQPRKCRSDTIMARILAEKTKSSFAPSHSFRRCTTFWRGTTVIGDRLRELRDAKQLSQGDIESRTGLLRCYISRVENGHTVPAFETMEKFAHALEIPLYQLFYDGDAPPPMPHISKRKGAAALVWGRSGKEAQLLEQFRRLLSRATDDDRKLLLFM